MPNSISNPNWIMLDERGKFFCVSEQQGLQILLHLLAAACLLALCNLAAFFRGRALPATRFWYGCYSVARSAWHRTVQWQLLQSLSAGVLLLFYLTARAFRCLTTLQRLQFPVTSTHLHVVQAFQTMFAAWVCHETVRFYASYQLKRRSQVEQRRQRKNGSRRRAVVVACVWNTWALVCLSISSFSAIFSFVRDIPGLPTLSPWFSWTLNESVALATVLLTTFVLPTLAAQLSMKATTCIDEADLLMFGKILATPFVPFFVTVACHADCFGAWVFFWTPCTSKFVDVGALSTVSIRGSVVSGYDAHQLVARSELCSADVNLTTRRCSNSVLERLAQILFSQFVHLAFTFPAGRILAGRCMSLRGTWVLLAYVWLLVLMLGPSLPPLVPLAFLVAVVHAMLLFDRFTLLHKDRSGDNKARLPPIGLKCALGFAVLLQSCIAA
eukprot:6467096-Amphidinium_carterae.2